MATRVIAVRHGETDWNRATRMQGHLDVPLNEKGIWQAKQLADVMAAMPLVAIYTSDLSRAHVTAQAISTVHPQVPVVPMRGLRERCFGVFEGYTFAENEVRDPEGAALWKTRDVGYAPPGGESLIDLDARVSEAMDFLAASHPDHTVALVAHGGVLDILYRRALGLNLEAARAWDLTNTAINTLEWTAPGVWNVIEWGNVHHLSASEVLDEKNF